MRECTLAMSRPKSRTPNMTMRWQSSTGAQAESPPQSSSCALALADKLPKKSLSIVKRLKRHA